MNEKEKRESDVLKKGDDGIWRCWWCGDDPLYIDYHDNEWGREVTDDYRLFEKICLEGFQAGLSWITILRKRENFRKAFAKFNFNKVAKFDEQDIERLVGDAGIIRHKGKIKSTINNAKLAIAMKKEHDSLLDFFQQYRPAKVSKIRSKNEIQSVTEESKKMSKDLKKLGWSFVGPTTCYAFMQAMGLVNDHGEGCKFRKDCRTR